MNRTAPSCGGFYYVCVFSSLPISLLPMIVQEQMRLVRFGASWGAIRGVKWPPDKDASTSECVWGQIRWWWRRRDEHSLLYRSGCACISTGCTESRWTSCSPPRAGSWMITTSNCWGSPLRICASCTLLRIWFWRRSTCKKDASKSDLSSSTSSSTHPCTSACRS